MNPKPRPNQELVIEALSKVRYLIITTSSQDAKSFIQSNLPEYITYVNQIETNGTTRFSGQVIETYDFNEVVAYLRSYNDEEA